MPPAGVPRDWVGEARAYFVGAGPGGAPLMTSRALEVLERAEVVLHDLGVHGDVLARCPVAAARVAVGEGELADAERVAARMIREARAGKIVVRLAAGDPMLFGQGDVEVGLVTAAGVALEVVPGLVPEMVLATHAGLA